MNQSTTLPFGTRPYRIEWPEGMKYTVVSPPAGESGPSLQAVLNKALDEPIGGVRLEEMSLQVGARVVIAISDSTRDDPRDAMMRAVLARLPADIQLTIAVANGTHGPCEVESLGLGRDLLEGSTVVNHDAHVRKDLVHLGDTARGTPVVVHRCVTEADLVIATGRIKPHYFAGYGAGCKAIFPGLGGNREIRINHELKREIGARPGMVEGNPCRDDLEEAVAMVPSPKFLLNLVSDIDGNARLAVAGDVRQAFQVGARACESMYKVYGPRSRLVIVSDALPLSGSLYQASKLVAGAAGLLLEGGVMIVVAQCPDGVGPVDTVNHGIYELGLIPRLPSEHRIILVSDCTRTSVEATYCGWAPSVESVLDQLKTRGEDTRATVVPRAGTLIVEPED